MNFSEKIDVGHPASEALMLGYGVRIIWYSLAKTGFLLLMLSFGIQKLMLCYGTLIKMALQRSQRTSTLAT